MSVLRVLLYDVVCFTRPRFRLVYRKMPNLDRARAKVPQPQALAGVRQCMVKRDAKPLADGSVDMSGSHS